MVYTEHTLGKMSVLAALYREKNAFFCEWSSNRLLHTLTGLSYKEIEETRNICRRLDMGKMADCVRKKNGEILEKLESDMVAKKMQAIEHGEIHIPHDEKKEEYASCGVHGFINGLIYLCTRSYIESIVANEVSENISEDMSSFSESQIIEPGILSVLVTSFIGEYKNRLEEVALEYDIPIQYICDMAGLFNGEYEEITEWIAKNTKEGECIA